MVVVFIRKNCIRIEWFLSILLFGVYKKNFLTWEESASSKDVIKINKKCFLYAETYYMLRFVQIRNNRYENRLIFLLLDPISLGGVWFMIHRYSVFHTFIWRGWVGGLNQMKLTSFEKNCHILRPCSFWYKTNTRLRVKRFHNSNID
jgi:hypothetical protein